MHTTFAIHQGSAFTLLQSEKTMPSLRIEYYYLCGFSQIGKTYQNLAGMFTTTNFIYVEFENSELVQISFKFPQNVHVYHMF